MGKFINFDRMITPLLIKLFFWLGVIGIILASFVSIGFGLFSKNGSLIQVIIGIVMLFLGPIFIRIYCEMLIVFFKMQESLVQIRDYHAQENRAYDERLESSS